MKNINEIEDNINELILQKSFDKLSVDEKEKAIAYAGSEEQYNSLRTTLLAITTSFNIEEEVSIDKELKNDLLDQFEKKFGSSGNRVKIVPIYRKPFFQLAVAASVAMLVFFTLPFFNTTADQQGQLAMNPKKETSPVTTGTVDEKAIQDLSITHEANEATAEKPIDATLKEGGKLEDNIAESEGPLKSLNNVAPVLDKNMGDDLVAADEIEKSEKDISVVTKSKPKNIVGNNGTTTNVRKDDFLLERVMKERKEAELAKGKKKEESKDLANNDREKNNAKKMDADKMLESAAGSVNDSYLPSAPSSTVVLSSVSTFVQENKTEILDLLFTAF